MDWLGILLDLERCSLVCWTCVIAVLTLHFDIAVFLRRTFLVRQLKMDS